METQTPELSPAVQEGLARWKSGTIQTMGPLIDTAAFNALSACLAGLDHIVAGLIATPTEPPRS